MTHVDEPATRFRDGGLTRLRLDLSYDGTDFSGWARQPGRRTVEQTVAESLATVLRLPAPVVLTVAGRTDAGVHATGQVAHVDVAAGVDVEDLVRRLRGLLPQDIALRRLSLAPAGFDARFAAVGRRYRYRVADDTADPLRRRDTLAWHRPVDVTAMHAAGASLTGEHDFAAYCKPRDGASTVRHLHELTTSRHDGVVVIEAYADAFCHNQVRALVGALLTVGDGRRPVGWPRAVLDAGVRDSSVPVVPPHGLTLVAVDYPPDDQLAARVAVTRSRRDPDATRAAAVAVGTAGKDHNGSGRRARRGQTMADERDRVADERDRRADERDHLADEREEISARRDLAADARDERVRELIDAADERDKEAERRDRAAEERNPVTSHAQAAIDRLHAGRDRDAAAVDREGFDSGTD